MTFYEKYWNSIIIFQHLEPSQNIIINLSATNYIIIQSHFDLKNKLKINKEWFEWFVGFTDAEGSFSIVKIKNNNFKFFFRIRLHKDDINVLQEISKMLNVTSPFLDKNSAVLQITKLTDIINIIIPIFNEIPLLTIKSLQFNIFKEAVYIKHNSKSKK